MTTAPEDQSPKRNTAKEKLKKLIEKIIDSNSMKLFPYEDDIENIVDAIVDAAVEEAAPGDMGLGDNN